VLAKDKQYQEIIMKNKIKNSLPVIFLFTLLTASYSSVVNAESLQQKLQLCKQEFAVAHQKDSTQEVAVTAKLKHLKLMKEIMHELNMKNADKNMTNAQLQENVMVMSHLLEMLVTENLNKKEHTWNLNY
jgi:hypothetical protein